jgi:hypothetical protein
VLDAAAKAQLGSCYTQFESIAAAALRAAANTLLNHKYWHDGFWDREPPKFYRKKLLAIADELEGVGDGQTIQNLSTQEQISEEENERRFKECMELISNLKPGEIKELMGPEFMEEFRRVSQ